MTERRRRTIAVTIITFLVVCALQFPAIRQHIIAPQNLPTQQSLPKSVEGTEKATDALANLDIKGRAPKTGYSREQFGNGWVLVGNCDVRNLVLQRDMKEVKLADDNCTVRSGVLNDPYTGKTIIFTRGPSTSSDVQIDHVVALADAWQKGAQYMPTSTRVQIASDSLNLLAVDGPSNQKKSAGDAATWLPPNKAYRCRYVARQIAVKSKYDLWVTQAEHDAMAGVLHSCPDQRLPIVTAGSSSK